MSDSNPTSGRQQLIERYGAERGAGLACAEAFEISEYGRHLTVDEINDYFPL
jgi:hypothetical protein